jgi:Zn-dependent M16 (insulinase) family peptidase
MGGAYGCFIQFGQISGNLAIVSYRDPQVKRTYDAYDAIPEVVADLELTEKVLEQLVVGTYGNFDPLQSAAAKGASSRNEFLNGITPDFKKQRLSEIITTEVKDLRAFAADFRQMRESCHRKIIGNRGKIEKDARLFDTLQEL